MKRLETYIAWRYLFSKKGHNAINIVTGVSAGAVAVVTAALVCVLSVMNGFGRLVEGMFSDFDPELRITCTDSKYFRTDTLPILELRQLPYVTAVSETVEETALLRYKEHQTPAHVMGVDSVFEHITHIDSLLVDGFYSVWDGAFDRAVVGRGLASTIGINAHFVGALHFYAPKRTGRINTMRPDDSFRHEYAYIAGEFAVNQVAYDDQYILVSLPLARRLFEYDSCTVTSLSLQLQQGTRIRTAKREISRLLGPGYLVADRYQQQADFFRIFKIEKWLTALLLLFILLIASFNIVGSLNMLILDKQETIHILSHLGASPATIRRIFLLEGWLISSLGALAGLVLGTLLCLVQQHFGLITLGNGEDYIIRAYPVAVEAMDILAVMIMVLLVGFLAAWYPVRKLETAPTKA